jgi:condensation domain-containing protein
LPPHGPLLSTPHRAPLKTSLDAEIVTRPSPPASFNVLQQTMALWEQAHPYNGGHAVRLDGPADKPALHEAILLACRTAGVGNLVVDREANMYWYEPLDAVELREIRSDEPECDLLQRTITDEINRAFPLGAHHPVRWCLLDRPGSGWHWLVAIYRHLAADSVSMRLLVGRVLDRYYRMPRTAGEKPFNMQPPDYADVMRHQYRTVGGTTFLHRAMRLGRQILRAYTPHEASGLGDLSHFRIFETAPDLLSRLLKSCKKQQVTVNEAFLTALCEALAATTRRDRSPWFRPALAVLSAVDVRRFADRDLSNCFGVYLGGVVTFVSHPEGADPTAVFHSVLAETGRERAERRSLGPHWNLRLQTWLGRRFRLANGRAWYAMVYPLSGSLSNAQFETAGFTAAGDRILEYLRVPPTSRAVPWVLTPTTCDGRLSLCLVYRVASLSDADAGGLVRLFLARLEAFAQVR